MKHLVENNDKKKEKELISWPVFLNSFFFSLHYCHVNISFATKNTRNQMDFFQLCWKARAQTWVYYPGFSTRGEPFLEHLYEEFWVFDIHLVFSRCRGNSKVVAVLRDGKSVLYFSCTIWTFSVSNCLG